MRFHPSSEQDAIQHAVRGTLERLLPRERLVGMLDERLAVEPKSWSALMELGLGGLLVPEEAGGSGLGLIDAALAVECVGAAAAPGPMIGQIVTGLAVHEAANPACTDILSALVSGERIAALAWGNASAPDGWAVSHADGRLTGTVDFVQDAEAADLFLVGTEGGGLALAETGEGVSIDPQPSTDRTRVHASVIFDNAKANLLFEPGAAQTARLFDAALVLIAADALGGADYALDLSVSYAKEREQFGRLIGSFQALKHQLADAALSVEPARALVWYAAYAFDQGLPDRARAAALAKAHLCERAVEVQRAAIAAHGGIGYTWDYGLNIWFRRSVANAAQLGTPEAHYDRAAELAGW